MATEVGAAAVLAALASDRWTAVRDAVERISDLLRADAIEAGAVEQFASKLVALATHPKWEVRKAVAEALQYLRSERYYAILMTLTGDDNTFVAGAARSSLARRTALLHTDPVAEQRGDILDSWLDEVAVTYGSAARKLALRIAERYAELIVREARHEIVRALSPVDAALGGLTRELEKQRVDRKACRVHLTRARGGARMTNAIVKSLLAYTTRVTMQFRNENLVEVIDQAVSIAKLNAKRRRVDVEVVCARDVHVTADRVRLVQALSNIIQNAIEAYPKNGSGTVEVSARTVEPHEVVLRITDGGCGMSDEACRDAICLYSTSKPGGTGFGLPLAKKIVEMEHHGGLAIVSKKGEGTTVTVVLPMEQSA